MTTIRVSQAMKLMGGGLCPPIGGSSGSFTWAQEKMTPVLRRYSSGIPAESWKISEKLKFTGIPAEFQRNLNILVKIIPLKYQKNSGGINSAKIPVLFRCNLLNFLFRYKSNIPHQFQQNLNKHNRVKN